MHTAFELKKYIDIYIYMFNFLKINIFQIQKFFFDLSLVSKPLLNRIFL